MSKSNPKILSIVLAGGEGTRLMPLTRDRAKPAVPFGGVFRLVDFPLSNLVNSGYQQVIVLTQYKSHSLDRHISQVWRFSPLLGSYVSPVPAQQRLGKHWYLGSADAIYQTINIIEDVQPDIVVIVGADHVYRMDFEQMVQQHIESGAEFTVAGIRQPIEESNQFGVIEVDPDHPSMIKNFQEKPATTTGLPDNPNQILASMGNYVANTKALFAETIANPALTVLDIEKFAAVAHRHGVPLIVDNTFATPINCRPFEWGADIVTHSTTKYMDGHAATVGGCIVDSGNFDWEAHHDRFKGLTEPDESYHGTIYTQKFGKLAYITKATSQLMRDLGSIQSPQNAFLINIGLETLHLRMPRHCANALAVARYLKSREDVAWVSYPGLEGDKYYDLAKKYMPNGTCGVISFGLKGGRQAAAEFMDKLKLCSIETHVADSRTAVLHPASHTHRQLNEEQLKAAGVDPSMIRFSLGLEDVEDIIEDVRQALEN